AYRADFVTFMTIATASIAGSVIALILTRLLRVISADLSAQRLVRRGWGDLAALARRPRRQTVPQFAMRMLDRLSLLPPRAARAAPSYELCLSDALRDLQIGFSLSELAAVDAQLPETNHRLLRDLRARLGDYFDALSEGAADSSCK